MASRMNSGGSIDLNRIKIDPRTGEKFSFNLDIVAATAWYDQEAKSDRPMKTTAQPQVTGNILACFGRF